MPQIVRCGRHVSVSKSSYSPHTAMMTALNRSRPPFSNTTRLHVSPSSRWPMTSVFCEIGCMPKRSPIGCLSFCLTLTVIAGRDGCTCPHEVGNCPGYNAFGNFDHTGYVRDWDEKKRPFEVIVGKSILAFTREDEEDVPSSRCFGFVQTVDPKPKRRLFELWQSQGLQMNQQLTFPSDSGDTVRDLQWYLSPEAEHLLDWFHVAMRLTVLQQTAKGLPETTSDGEDTYTLRDEVVRELERLQWFLWHGNVYRSLQVVQSVEMDLDAAVANDGHATARKLLKAVEEFHTYIANNKGFIPNYGERYHAGERISTGVVESTVNQVVIKRFCKRQQMQ